MKRLAKIVYMLKKASRDVWRLKRKVEVNPEVKSNILLEYYILFDIHRISTLNRLIVSFDDKGVPLNESYVDVAEEDRSVHYYPITIGQFGLAVFHEYLKTNEEKYKDQFIAIADWFMENKVCTNELGCYWLTHIPKPEYEVSEPWKSAFSQSRALSILMRAWQLTGEKMYLEIAEQALKIFSIKIQDGGVSVDRKVENSAFYEEYVASYPTRVLDGHIFSLFGLLDFIRAGRESQKFAEAKKLYNEGMNGLLRLLPEYDLGFWVQFNICEGPKYPKPDPCSIGYLKLVTAQLGILNEVSKHDEISLYIRKFSSYLKIKNIIRMYYLKFKVLRRLNRL